MCELLPQTINRATRTKRYEERPPIGDCGFQRKLVGVKEGILTTLERVIVIAK